MHEFAQKTDVPVIIIDAEGEIIFINQKFTEIYLFTEADLIGHQVTEIIPHEFRDAHNMGFSRYITSKQSQVMNQALNLKILKKDQTVVDALHFITASEDHDGLQIGATITLI